MTIIVPAYNEEKSLSSAMELLKANIQDKSWKIIVVNDGSTDNTKDVLTAISGITVITHEVNKGYGASLKTGILNSDTDFVAFYDADGQHKPEDLIKLVIQADGFDMVVGSRGKQFYSTPLRTPGKWIMKYVAEILSGTKIDDLNSGLRVVKRDLIRKQIHLFPDGFSFSTTSTLAFFYYKLKVKYVPIEVQKRTGNSSVKIFKHGLETLLLILRLVMLFNPLKIFLPFSIAIIGSGVVYQIYIFIVYGLHIEGGSILAILGGGILFFNGLLADQISSLRLNGTNNP